MSVPRRGGVSRALAALCVALTATSLVAQTADGEQASTNPALPRVLFLTHSAGFEHGVVKRETPDALSHAERALAAAVVGRFDLTLSKDCSVLSAGGLPNFDAVLFYTTGELPVTPADRTALMTWIRDGGGFMGLHCASDTFYEYPPYLEMVGGTFDGHPWHQQLTLDVTPADRPGFAHPATAHLADTWELTDELYQFRSWQPEPLRVLLELDTSSVDVSRGKRDDGHYAVAWWRDYGLGRVFYSALGHRPELWEDDAYLEHVLGGLGWVIDGPDLPAPVPQGAVVLLGPLGSEGASASGSAKGAWSHRDGAPFAWMAPPVDSDSRIDSLQHRRRDDGAPVVPGTGDLVSTQTFGDALYHVEFSTPLEPDAEGQARGNSGVYVQGRYEVQVLDSYEREPGLDTCGAIYGQHVPAAVASRPPERWQSYDIRFTAPRFDDSDTKTASARMSVWHNGLLIHDDVAVNSPTLAGLATDEVPLGPLMLQDHGDVVLYRNVWVLPTR